PAVMERQQVVVEVTEPRPAFLLAPCSGLDDLLVLTLCHLNSWFCSHVVVTLPHLLFTKHSLHALPEPTLVDHPVLDDRFLRRTHDPVDGPLPERAVGSPADQLQDVT